MEIITEINTNDLFKIMMNQTKGTNTKSFCEDLNNSYYLFDKCINYLINIDYDLTYLIDEIHTRIIFIGNEQDKNELSENDFLFFELEQNLYLIVEN